MSSKSNHHPFIVRSPKNTNVTTMFGMLFLAADFAFDESSKNRPKDRRCGQTILQRILKEAENKGFEHGAILETLLARYNVSSRTHLLVYRVIYLVGKTEFMDIYQKTLKEFYIND